VNVLQDPRASIVIKINLYLAKLGNTRLCPPGTQFRYCYNLIGRNYM